MSERVFLTGAAGRIGRIVLDGLLAEGYAVRALVHRGREGFPSDPRVDVFPGDILDRDSLSRGMEGCAYAVHLAAAWDMFPPALFEKGNDQLFDSVIKGTYNLLEVCRNLKGFKALVYASTDAVYSTGPRHFDAPITEDTELRPSRFYAIAKIACESLCRQYGSLYGLPWLVVRICWSLRPAELLRVFSYEFWEGGMGEDDRARLKPKLAEGRGLFAPLCADGSSGVEHIADPEDIASGIVRAVVRHAEGLGGTFNLAGPAPFRYLDVIEKPAKLLGIPWDSARIPGIEPYELRNDHAIGVLGYAPAWTMERMLEKAALERLAADRGGRS
jgi:nucleoside-diphosphate-sugar epimerase